MNENQETTTKHFPKVLVRSSRKVINEYVNVMRCLVLCISETIVSGSQACKILANVANLVFNQDWKLPLQNKEDKENNDVKRQ